MQLVLIVNIKDDDEAEFFRGHHLISESAIAMQKLPSGNYLIIKGNDNGTVVRPENLVRILNNEDQNV